MRHLKFVYLLAGLGLFAALLWAFDTRAALDLLARIGWWGLPALIGAFLLAFAFDVAQWQLAFAPGEAPARLFAKFFRVRLIGEAFNLVVPAGGFGGEPVKAVLLKRECGLGYAESGAAIVLARMAALAAQFAFVLLALILMWAALDLPHRYTASAWTGLAVLAFMTVTFLLLPRLRLSSRLAAKRPRLAKGLAGIEAAENGINAFARRYPARHAALYAVSFLRWAVGALEMWLAFRLLGHPIGIAEALVLEAILQMVRSVSFFVPASLGAQDGALALFAGAVTGAPAAALGVALLRRAREIVMVALGFALGGWTTWRNLRRDAASKTAKGRE